MGQNQDTSPANKCHAVVCAGQFCVPFQSTAFIKYSMSQTSQARQFLREKTYCECGKS